jgi:uncharacterized protein (DUF2147 family)
MLSGPGSGCYGFRRNSIAFAWGLALAEMLAVVSGSALAENIIQLPEASSSVWVNPQQGWVVEAHLCGTELCSHLIAFRMVHPHPPGYIPLDENNIDPKLRGRPLCGVQLMGGFDPAKRKDNKLDGGWVYDPQTGKKYSASLTLVDADHVKLRGYIGIPLFGKTLNLHREDEPAQRCTMPPN